MNVGDVLWLYHVRMLGPCKVRQGPVKCADIGAQKPSLIAPRSQISYACGFVREAPWKQNTYFKQLKRKFFVQQGERLWS